MKKEEFVELLKSKNIDFKKKGKLIVINHQGNVDLESLTTLPEGVKFENQGYVDLESLTTLPEDVKFENQGNVYLESLTTLPEGIKFENQGNVDLRSLTTLPEGIKVIDNYGMKINSRKTTKGIVIYDCNYLGNKEHCYVAEKDGYYAHGKSIKKAVSDVEFKIMAKKLKKEPIERDTMVDVNHYRLLTGACEMGVNNWMKQNNMTKDSYRADELLPLLEKTNAYGLDKFKELINF